MAFQDVINELKDFNYDELNYETIGSWPAPVKVIIWLLAFTACLAGGYFYVIADLQAELASVEAKELKLKKEFSRKSAKAANLDAYRLQMVEMQESFGALVSQLPSETEVPGLLEDITNKGRENGLDIKLIKLKKEKRKEFYIELPINIVVEGSYHDMSAFVSGIAGLPRIVTLHDFSIKSLKGGVLQMNITAKTYRYRKGA